VPVFRAYRIGHEPSLGETFAIEAGPFAARPQTGRLAEAARDVCRRFVAAIAEAATRRRRRPH
jgi:hypothetical protein